jgi:hypothetical protein
MKNPYRKSRKGSVTEPANTKREGLLAFEGGGIPVAI